MHKIVTIPEGGYIIPRSRDRSRSFSRSAATKKPAAKKAPKKVAKAAKKAPKKVVKKATPKKKWSRHLFEDDSDSKDDEFWNFLVILF